MTAARKGVNPLHHPNILGNIVACNDEIIHIPTRVGSCTVGGAKLKVELQLVRPGYGRGYIVGSFEPKVIGKVVVIMPDAAPAGSIIFRHLNRCPIPNLYVQPAAV